jgi:SPP1 family phage portal protein
VISLNTIEELTESVIKRIVEKHRGEVFPRLKKLEDYYNANNEINRRIMKDCAKPNNKIANAYASYITDTLTGYFIGEPITYTSNDENLL